MRNKYVYTFVMLLLIAVVLSGGTYAYVKKQERQEKTEEITVVTSFYPMYVATANLVKGVEGVELKNLSEPQTGCLHDFQLTPEDMRLLEKADVFVINGSGAENFLEDVIEAYPDVMIVNATEEFPEAEEETYMHAWMTPAWYHKEVSAIADALKKICQNQGDMIALNEKSYVREIQKLEAKTQDLKQELEEADLSSVILFSEAYEGLSEALGLKVEYLMDLDEERQVSSGEVAQVLDVIEKNPKSFIIAEDPYGKELAKVVEKQTGIKVLYFNTLTRGAYQMNTYIDGMKQNLAALEELLAYEIN